jgi:F-type H+-transporting ATPase subunit b
VEELVLLPVERTNMNATVLLATVESGGKVEEIARTFGVDWSHLVAQIISFTIVCILLHRFAYKRILDMLEERRRQIKQGLLNTEKISAELARTEVKNREMMIRANIQATNLIEEARAAASQVQAQETQKAIAAAEMIIVKAHEAAARDHERMLSELKREVGRLVVQTTANVTGKILTPEDQRRMAEETAKQIAA